MYYIYLFMDRRIIKTRAAIYKALGTCLKTKDYNDLAIEDILQQANVSRSTFYAHFKTKDDLLDSLLDNIFHHVFSHTLSQEETHDFSHENILDYKHLFTHTIYHLRDEKELIQTILKASCRDRFIQRLQEHIAPLITKVVKEGVFEKKDVPEGLHIAAATQSFIALVIYYFDGGCTLTPEQVTDYFFELN